jgi:high-affinity iron transporter
LSALLFVLPAAQAAQGGDRAAQQALHLLEYIAVDYPEAVRGGEVANPLEYEEQLQFVGVVGDLLTKLGVSAAGDVSPLRRALSQLEEAIRIRAEERLVAGRARSLAEALRERFRVRALPLSTPSLERGRRLYVDACSSCHGPHGRGDGPAGVGLQPPPSDFTHRARSLELSLFALYSTISLGIQGTAMVGYADRFGEDQRYDLAFYVGSLAFSPAEVQRGRRIAAAGAEPLAQWVPDLAALVQQPASTLSADSGTDGEALIAYLRTHPEALRRGQLPIGITLHRLATSWKLYGEGKPQAALDLAVSAYLDHFEPIEPTLDALDRKLRMTIEADFMLYRAGLRANRPPEALASIYADLNRHLSEARERLTERGLGNSALAASALTIVAREGLEALLIVVAISAALLRAGQREALPYVHAGWVSALPAGALTWLVARSVVELSGAAREVIEGVTSLLATAMLFYVSYWLLSRIETRRWQSFVNAQVSGALSRSSRWGLAAVAFIAVYRELFETILFFEALGAQAGPGGARSLGVGVAAGAGLLGLLAVAILRFGMRVPLRPFFALSSAVLYGLAFVLAGQGVAALQEAGWLSATGIGSLRIEWIGIRLTREGLAVQGLLVVAALAAIPRSLRRPVATAALLACCLSPLTGCAGKLARETVLATDRTTVVLRQRPDQEAPGEVGFAHPAIVAPSRVASILSYIDVRPKEGEPRAREPAIPSEILFEMAKGISQALARADASQEVIVMSRRKDRRFGIFTREHLTSLVTFVRGERLEVHLSRVDWPVPGDPGHEVREPWVGERVMNFRVVPTEGIEPIGPQSVAAVWRDPLFQSTRSVKWGPGGRTRRRTILMESPIEPEPVTAPPAGDAAPLTPAAHHALEELEQARREGEITEAEYRARREEILTRK